MADTFSMPFTGADSLGYLKSTNATYATARSGGTIVLTAGDYALGQNTGYTLYEQFGPWDTSAIPDANVISEAHIDLRAGTIAGSGYTVEVRACPWTSPLGVGGWVPGDSLAGLTLLASIPVASLSTSAYVSLTSTADLIAAINKTGLTRVIIVTSKLTNGTAPTALERILLGYVPRLVVTHAAAAAAPTVTSLATSTGPTAGGTSVVITGTGFTGATSVQFGATDAPTYNVDSATQITVTSPAHAAGVVDITVTTAAGTSEAVAGDQFTYADEAPAGPPRGGLGLCGVGG